MYRLRSESWSAYFHVLHLSNESRSYNPLLQYIGLVSSYIPPLTQPPAYRFQVYRGSYISYWNLSEGMMEFPCGWRNAPVLFVPYKGLLRGDKIHFVLSLSFGHCRYAFQKHKNIPYTATFPFLFTLRHWEPGEVWSRAQELGIGFRQKAWNWQRWLSPRSLCLEAAQALSWTVLTRISVDFWSSLIRHLHIKLNCTLYTSIHSV